MKKIIEEHFQKEDEYSNIIVISPQSIFQSVDNEMVNKWKVIMELMNAMMRIVLA